MTVAELIEQLNELDPSAEVLIATQPAWPLRFEVGGLAVDFDGDDGTTYYTNHYAPGVYILAGDHPTGGSPYAPEGIFTDKVVS